MMKYLLSAISSFLFIYQGLAIVQEFCLLVCLFIFRQTNGCVLIKVIYLNKLFSLFLPPVLMDCMGRHFPCRKSAFDHSCLLCHHLYTEHAQYPLFPLINIQCFLWLRLLCREGLILSSWRVVTDNIGSRVSFREINFDGEWIGK